MLALNKEVGLAFWLRATYITPDTGELAARASERSLAFDSALIAQAKALKGVPTDPESARAIELILRGSSMPAPNDPALRAEYERDFKLKRDPRITSIGRFLRRSSLDELPQFLNVLRGEMSVVGPRPIVDKELQRYGAYMDEVASVRPGLTGLWQVSGRNNLSYKKRVKLDLAYARGRSFNLDLAIILRTFGVLLLPMDRGAY